MIIAMTRVRVIGPRDKLAPTLRVLQDLGVVQIVDAGAMEGLHRLDLDPIARRRRRHVSRALGDIEHALDAWHRLGLDIADREGPAPPEARVARLAAKLAEQLDQSWSRVQALVEERDALLAYEPLFGPLEELVRARRASLFLLTLRSAAALDALRTALEKTLDGAVELHTYTRPSGEALVLLAVPAARAGEIDDQLAKASVDRAPLPPALSGVPLTEALARLRPRLREVERDLLQLHEDAASLARRHGDDLVRARRAFHDELLVLDAEDHAAASARAFVLEGWLPARDKPRLVSVLQERAGGDLAVEEVARDELHGDDAPVVLSNPRLFQPFEALISMLPLPRYGTIDPTPFVAVFFPMLFGVIVGDVGYGAAIAVLGLFLGRYARIAYGVAFYTIAFGVLYGECFGDLGTRWFGMHPLWFDRQQAVLAFLVLAVALGLVHLLLGLVLAAITRWRGHRREAIGRGLTAVMLVLVAIALASLFERAPAVLLTPAVIALLVALPVVIVLEGITALFDFMTILGHVMSYARVMALGMASVMLAVVANKMHGAFGTAAIGIAFALVFHILNFAITLFSPTIHVMRLHYVEFFGTFFEPGGGPYRPLRHWSQGAAS